MNNGYKLTLKLHVLTFLFFINLFSRRIEMLEITEAAIAKLKEYVEQNKIDSAIRIALMQGG